MSEWVGEWVIGSMTVVALDSFFFFIDSSHKKFGNPQNDFVIW